MRNAPITFYQHSGLTSWASAPAVRNDSVFSSFGGWRGAMIAGDGRPAR